MKSHPKTKALCGLIASAMFAANSQGEVTLSDFTNPFALSGTYVQWDAGTFTSGATAFRVQANDFGGGFKSLAPAINAAGEDTISIKLDVNSGNVANKFNIVLVDGDGTERAFRFDGLTIGNNQTLTKSVSNFLQDNAGGSVPGLNLANLTAFHIQGTFTNGNPGQAMDLTFDKLSLVVAPFVPDTIVNGNFEIPGGTGWGTTQGIVTYPTTDGNPNGNAVLESTGGFAVLYAFNNQEKTFASLGLSPGDTYTFQMDMKVISGDIGGIRLEGPAGYVVDQFAPANTGGSGWATYSFELTVPATPAQSKFGLRVPNGSKVAFDNVGIVLPGPPPPPVASIVMGNQVGWTAASAVNSYQPQESTDNSTWTNLGSPIVGNTVTAVFDASKSPFYQVLETTQPTFGNGVLNPGFETTTASFPANLPTFGNPGAVNWNIPVAPNANAIMTVAGSYPGTSLTPHGGSQMLVLESITPLTGPVTPPDVNVRADSVTVTPNTTYTFTFWAANPVKIGGANPQFYFDFFGPDPIFGDIIFLGNSFTSFAAPDGTWTLITKTFTTPANATSMSIGFIQAMGAGNAWQWITLIDDINLPVAISPGTTTTLAATVVPAAQVSWTTVTGSNYQVKSSPNLSSWSDFGSSVAGTGGTFSVVDPVTIPAKFYRVLQTTP